MTKRSENPIFSKKKLSLAVFVKVFLLDRYSLSPILRFVIYLEPDVKITRRHAVDPPLDALWRIPIKVT